MKPAAAYIPSSVAQSTSVEFTVSKSRRGNFGVVYYIDARRTMSVDGARAGQLDRYGAAIYKWVTSIRRNYGVAFVTCTAYDVGASNMPRKFGQDLLDHVLSSGGRLMPRAYRAVRRLPYYMYTRRLALDPGEAPCFRNLLNVGNYTHPSRNT